ncbi:glucocorticoid-induced transcript 1 protein-like [Saccostrea echinata]|uniref:glucocorticoid-induced transcript 1 protein-like n=1 Tax=Saccostrea echinata TaxID=191078 RepID=UPI002A7FB666|nr:glucocorticoid-induced transcript 1 protein-like [Saccostrea echinata]
MSTQPQRVRKNASPSTMRPMKAVQPFKLKGSPTRKSPSSPTPWVPRRSPDSNYSPERKSPNSPSFKVERPKAVRVTSSPLKRTGSLEAIYLKGQWPSPEFLSSFKVDACTQTEEADVARHSSHKLDKKQRKKSKDHRRSRSFGPGDQLAAIRQRLKNSSRSDTPKARQSPIPASHDALSATAPAALQNLIVPIRTSKPLGIPAHIPSPKNMSRYQRNSVEGLSMEIEKLVLKNIEHDTEEAERIEIPDGHRAPVPEPVHRTSSTRSMETQTPSGVLDTGTPTISVDDMSSGSGSHSGSPAIPIIPGQMDSSRPSSGADSGNERTEKDIEGCESPDSHFKVVASPRPNKSYSFVREPPDGCEKIKVITEEDKKPSQPSIKVPLLCPIKTTQYVFKPSIDSAFCPLRNMYTNQGTQPTPAPITN